MTQKDLFSGQPELKISSFLTLPPSYTQHAPVARLIICVQHIDYQHICKRRSFTFQKVVFQRSISYLLHRILPSFRTRFDANQAPIHVHYHCITPQKYTFHFNPARKLTKKSRMGGVIFNRSLHLSPPHFLIPAMIMRQE